MTSWIVLFIFVAFLFFVAGILVASETRYIEGLILTIMGIILLVTSVAIHSAVGVAKIGTPINLESGILYHVVGQTSITQGAVVVLEDSLSGRLFAVGISEPLPEEVDFVKKTNDKLIPVSFEKRPAGQKENVSASSTDKEEVER